MKIEAVTVYKFTFPYENSELTIPIAGILEEDVRMKLRGLFLQWANDLAMPTGAVLSPVQQKETPMPTIPQIPSTPLLELRIEDMLKSIVDAKIRPIKGTVAATVKDWTGFKHEPSNYLAILEELLKIQKNG